MLAVFFTSQELIFECSKSSLLFLCIVTDLLSQLLDLFDQVVKIVLSSTFDCFDELFGVLKSFLKVKLDGWELIVCQKLESLVESVPLVVILDEFLDSSRLISHWDEFKLFDLLGNLRTIFKTLI